MDPPGWLMASGKAFSPQPKPGCYLLVLVDPTTDLPAGWVRSSSLNVARVRATKDVLATCQDIIGWTEKDCGVDEVPPPTVRGACRPTGRAT